MKTILLAAVMILTVGFASAQESSIIKGKTRFSVGLEAGIPVGDAGDAYKLIIGGSAKVEVPVATSFFATGSAGYINFSPKKEYKDLGLESEGFIPVKAGGKYFFTPNVYGAGELGVVFGTGDEGGTAFAWTPGVGISYPVSDKNDIDFDVRYEGWSDDGASINQIAFRIALKF
jgi:opacity protein-like surface antigen